MIISPEIHLQSESLFCILQLVGPKRIILCLVFFLSTFGVICGRFFFFQWIPFICWSNKRKEFIWSSLTNNPIEVDCIFFVLLHLKFETSNIRQKIFESELWDSNYSDLEVRRLWSTCTCYINMLRGEFLLYKCSWFCRCIVWHVYIWSYYIVKLLNILFSIVK